MEEEIKRERRNELSREYYRRHRDKIQQRNLIKFRANHSQNLARRRELYQLHKNCKPPIEKNKSIVFNGKSIVKFE
jgi:hypothetical protein